MRTEDIATVCHEANRALQLVQARDGDTGIPVSPHWAELDDGDRKPVVSGVELAVRGATPEELHEAWCKAKREAGWTFGEIKDPAAKTHPCLVDYADLPDRQRRKDSLFAAVVAVLAA